MMTEEVQANSTDPQGISKFYYSVGDYNILLEPGIKTEIIEKKDVFPIPHSPLWCQGMISLRGKLIPVVGLHKLLDDTKASNSNWLLVMEKETYPQLALRIDQLPKQQSFQDQPAESIDGDQLPSWFKAVIAIDGKKIYEADHTEFFDQLIQENELSLINNKQEPQPTPNQDSSGNDS